MLPFVLWLLLLAPGPAPAQPPIKIGMTAPLSDDAGSRIVAGMRFAFAEANSAGGMLSRNVTLVALDDGYNVTTSLANIHRLLDVENVLLLAGLVGSDVVDAAKPLILQRQ
eukprot:EG_transcript_61439